MAFWGGVRGRAIGVVVWWGSKPGFRCLRDVATPTIRLPCGQQGWVLVTPPAGGVLPVANYLWEPTGEHPKRRRFTVAQPTGSPTQIGRARGRGGAPGRAATTVSAQAPNGLNQPSWRTHRTRLPPRSNPRWNTTEENPKKHPQQTRPNNPIVGVKTRRNINPVSVSSPKPCAVAAQRTPTTKKPCDSRNHNTTRLHAVQALTLACAAAHEHPTRGVSPDTTVHDGA